MINLFPFLDIACCGGFSPVFIFSFACFFTELFQKNGFEFSGESYLTVVDLFYISQHAALAGLFIIY